MRKLPLVSEGDAMQTRGGLESLVIDTLPDREARNPSLRFALHTGLPIGVSLLLHLVILGLLAVKSFDVLERPGVEVGEYQASLTESPADRMAEALEWSKAKPPDVTPTTERPEAFAASDDLKVRGFDFGPVDIAPTPNAGGGFGEGDALGLGDGPLALLGTGSGAGGPGSGGYGTGLGGGARVGRAGIWNLTVAADKVVYVIDFSGSIIVAVDELKRELKRSIGRLKPTQAFNVIVFYSTGAGPDERVRTEAFRGQLEAADAAARREFFQWIDQKAPRGATHPLQAMKRALALGPDTIFFFSDGYFDDGMIDEITRANAAVHAHIHCLVFDELLLQDTSELPRETEGARRLKRIAEANGGKVKIVTGKDLAH